MTTDLQPALKRDAEMTQIAGRAVAALLNPRPALLVTCCDLEGSPNVLTVAWHTPLSHDPPLVGISIGLDRFSHELIRAVGEFVLNVVGQSFRVAVEVCGNQSGREIDKIELAQLQLAPAHCVRPPVIVDALGHLECRVVNELACGDHTFWVGRVLYAEAQTGAFADEWDLERGDVLLCRQRTHFGRCMAGEV